VSTWLAVAYFVLIKAFPAGAALHVDLLSTLVPSHRFVAMADPTDLACLPLAAVAYRFLVVWERWAPPVLQTVVDKRETAMKLYNNDQSPNCLRVRAVAFELGVEFENVEVDLRTASVNPELLALNPNGKVPVLVDGGFVLWESRAINAYLASKVPERNLYPQDLRERALVDQWSLWQAIHLGPAMQKVAFERFSKAQFGLGAPDEAAAAAAHAEALRYLAVLETRLTERRWVVSELSLADFALASTFMFRKPAGISLSDFPGVGAWIGRVEALASWQRAVAPLPKV
jgi:glutathione S-transferase